jgi:RNA-directed DNA polymerase
MTDISRSERVLTKQKRIAELAKQKLKQGLTSLNQFIDLEWMMEAWRFTRKDGALGIDELTACEFEMELGTNLEILLHEAKSGNYLAPNIKRVHIPKGNGETRPIGITTIGDKVLQRAIVMLLEPIYEQIFSESSFGFRPNRNAHKACEELREAAREFNGGYVLEVDIKSYFDTIDKSLLRKFLQKRITDGVVLRLIDKWLNAGIVERGVLRYQDVGTPQGGVASPILSNIYLHYVLDEWFESEVKR